MGVETQFQHRQADLVLIIREHTSKGTVNQVKHISSHLRRICFLNRE
jgi:hypothetical protein